MIDDDEAAYWQEQRAMEMLTGAIIGVVVTTLAFLAFMVLVF